jgi:hypothetical protein
MLVFLCFFNHLVSMTNCRSIFYDINVYFTGRGVGHPLEGEAQSRTFHVETRRAGKCTGIACHYLGHDF